MDVKDKIFHRFLTSVCSCTKIGSTLIGYTQSVLVLGLRCRQNFSISATLCRGPIIRDCLLRRLATRRQSCCCCLSLGLCIRCCAKRWFTGQFSHPSARKTALGFSREDVHQLCQHHLSCSWSRATRLRRQLERIDNMAQAKEEIR